MGGATRTMGPVHSFRDILGPPTQGSVAPLLLLLLVVLVVWRGTDSSSSSKAWGTKHSRTTIHNSKHQLQDKQHSLGSSVPLTHNSSSLELPMEGWEDNN